MFYRASARDRARARGITGHALNLADGRVEVLACGPATAVDSFCDWLWQGSPASHVTAVEAEDVPPGSLDPWPTEFRTGR